MHDAETVTSDRPHFSSSWRFPSAPNHVQTLACSSTLPLRRFTRDGGEREAIFAPIPPPPAKNFAALQLLDDGGVLEPMDDV